MVDALPSYLRRNFRCLVVTQHVSMSQMAHRDFCCGGAIKLHYPNGLIEWGLLIGQLHAMLFSNKIKNKLNLVWIKFVKLVIFQNQLNWPNSHRLLDMIFFKPLSSFMYTMCDRMPNKCRKHNHSSNSVPAIWCNYALTKTLQST